MAWFRDLIRTLRQRRRLAEIRRGGPGRPDLGVPPQLLPPAIAQEYLVETFYEEEVLHLVEGDPARAPLLLRLAPALREHFGMSARLVLAQMYRLKEPIGPELHVVVYTGLEREDEIDTEYARFSARWLPEISGAGIRVQRPMSLAVLVS